jgi:hypothetical protein
VQRAKGGGYELAFPEQERELLGSLAEQLVDVLTESTDDPIVRRLFPTAYHEDAEKDREYQQLVRDALVERRLANLEVIRTTAPSGTELDEAQLTAWLQAVNDLRLVLGTRLDVGEEPIELDADDPELGVHLVYDYLGGVLAEIVDALEGDLPTPTDDDPLR